MVNPRLPHPVPVQLTGSNVSGVTIKLTNNDTGETVEQVTDSQGRCLFELANLEYGYEIGHKIKLEAIRSDTDMEYYVTTNGNETNPTWSRVENNAKYYFKANTARIKIDTTNFPDTYDTVQITLE